MDMGKVLIDGDIIAYRAAFSTQQDGSSDTEMKVDDLIQFILEKTVLFPELGLDYEVYLTGKGNFRYDIAKSHPYKGNRKSVQKPRHLQTARDHMEVYYQAIISKGEEADDLIASAVKFYRESDQQVLIVSADKDLAQLISKQVEQLLPPPTANPRLGWRVLNEQGVVEKFGVPPGAILDYLAIIGDQADNIPGLSGVGPKTASKWLQEFENLENVILNAGRLNPKRFCSLVYEKRDMLRMNIELVRLESDLELNLNDQLQPNLEMMEQIFSELEMAKSWEEAQKRYG